MPKQDEQQHDLRSYDPYLISYHEDTNTFTFTDPWVEVTHEDINNSNFNENIVEHYDSTTTTPSLPATTTSSNASESNNMELTTSSSDHHEDLNYINSSDKMITGNHQPPSSAAEVVEKVVEHKTEEVSCLSLPHLFAFTNDMKLSVHSSFKNNFISCRWILAANSSFIFFLKQN